MIGALLARFNTWVGSGVGDGAPRRGVCANRQPREPNRGPWPAACRGVAGLDSVRDWCQGHSWQRGVVADGVGHGGSGGGWRRGAGVACRERRVGGGNGMELTVAFPRELLVFLCVVACIQGREERIQKIP